MRQKEVKCLNILTCSAINMVGVFSLPPGWDASPLQRYLQVSICWYHVRECRKAVFCPRTQCYISDQSLCHSVSSPMLAIRPPRAPLLYRPPFCVAAFVLFFHCELNSMFGDSSGNVCTLLKILQNCWQTCLFNYSRTSCKRPPKMSSQGGSLWKVVDYLSLAQKSCLERNESLKLKSTQNSISSRRQSSLIPYLVMSLFPQVSKEN